MFDWDNMIPKPKSAEELFKESEERKKTIIKILGRPEPVKKDPITGNELKVTKNERLL